MTKALNILSNYSLIFFFTVVLVIVFLASCGPEWEPTPAPTPSVPGVQIQEPVVKVDPSGKTVEQKNVQKFYDQSNTPGSIQYLYIVSSYSGDVLIYSTVNGKVTSSGKRLQPYTGKVFRNNSSEGIAMGVVGVPSFVSKAGETVFSEEVIQADGTYGNDIDFLYWWDTKGVYHQQYLSSGMILHISDQPLVVNKVIINMDLSPKGGESKWPLNPLPY